MVRDLLIEVGTEELPASFLAGALEALPRLAGDMLGRARLDHGEAVALGTARRIALQVTAVAARQEDLSDQVLGPPASVAFDADGKPTKAALGFAKKQGVSATKLERISTKKGDYVAVQREEQGLAATDVLPALIGELIAAIPFPKTMRWGSGDVAFGRPVHWIVALLGGEVLSASFAGVTAARASRGHRFLAPNPVAIEGPGHYIAALREAHVIVDPSERRAAMHGGLVAAAKGLGGTLVEDDFLLGECAGLVEEPHVLPGSFEPAFLDLPEGVIVSVLRDHQRYFAVRSASGELLPSYLNVVNTANDPDAIAQGNDRVLRARLADARFFVDEDRKTPLADHARGLKRVVFQTKLGSVGEKATRIGALAAGLLAAPAEQKLAARAAVLCKADLVTLIVGEFPELQGDMGGFYAAEQGEPERVAGAIRDHYLPRGAGDTLPTDKVAAAVGLADRLDTLVGCFGIGLVPTGSADPYALRRAALGVVRIAIEGPLDVDLAASVVRAHGAYEKLQPLAEVAEALDTFFRARVRAYYGERHSADLIEACLRAWPGGSLRDFDARLSAVAGFRELPEYEALTVAFKRAFNIAKDASSGDPDPRLIEEGAERALFDCFTALAPTLQASVDRGDYAEALGAVARELRDPIDRFFEDVFVMVDDEALRENRLRLLAAIAHTLTAIAHFHELST